MNNKETLYKKVQDLFPSSLGEGDVVEVRAKQECEVLKVDGNQLLLLDNKGGTFWWFDYVANLIRKRITLSMVLEAWKPKEKKKGLAYLDDMEHLTVYFDIITILNEWQLRKEGKDLSLYDQSIDLIRLVWEILS